MTSTARTKMTAALPIKKSLSVGAKASADTPFCSVSASQGPQEEHGLHLLVPGASAVGGTCPPIKNCYQGTLTNLLVPHFAL